MSGRTFHTLNPKDNPYGDRPSKPPPEFYDGIEGKGASRYLQAMLAHQRPDGSFGWDGFIAGVPRHRMRRRECEDLLIRTRPGKDFSADDVLATAGVLMTWRQTFHHDESHHYHRQEELAVQWLSRAAHADEKTIRKWIELMAESRQLSDEQIEAEWKAHYSTYGGFGQRPESLRKIRYADRLYEKRRGVWVDVAVGRVVTGGLARHLEKLANGRVH